MPGLCCGEIDIRMGKPRTDQQKRNEAQPATSSPRIARRHKNAASPGFYFSESKEHQGECRIHVSAGPLSLPTSNESTPAASRPIATPVISRRVKGLRKNMAQWRRRVLEKRP